MRDPETRIERWLEDLAVALESASRLVARGREAYENDEAIRLAFEALSSRIGEVCKRLLAASPSRFSDAVWSMAARHRDFVVHHYDRINQSDLWVTVSEDFPRLAAAVQRTRDAHEGTQ